MPLGDLRGHLDYVDRETIRGWAQDKLDAERRVSLVVTVNGEVVGRVLANQYRSDLEVANVGSGRHCFSITIPGGLNPDNTYLIGVARETDGLELPGSPVLLEPVQPFDRSFADRLTKTIDTAVDAESEFELLKVLAAGTDQVLQRRADRESQRTARHALDSFRRRWGQYLPPVADQTPQPPNPARRVLFVDDTIPDSSRDAGSLALMSHMEAMLSLGYEVSLAPAQEMNGSAGAVQRLGTGGIKVWQAPDYVSVEDVLQRQHSGFDVVYLHKMSNASKYSALVRSYLPNAQLIYNVADLHFLRLARQAELEQRQDLLNYSKQVKLNEILLAWSADAVITHSVDEAAFLRHEIPAARTYVVPWAVAPKPTRTGFNTREGVLFIGSYTHSPNLDAANWLVQDIMPLVHQVNPDIVCTLAGSAMPESLRALEGPRVRPLGHVPDLGALMAETRLTVAPLRFGAGIKGKVLDSLAHGVPCVMSGIAAEGIPLPDLLRGYVGQSAAQIADFILTLHADQAANEAARAAGLDMIVEHYAAAQTTMGLRQVLEGRAPSISLT